MANYNEEIRSGDVMPIANFRSHVKRGALIDEDGFGHPAKDGKADEQIRILPSRTAEIPKDATHIVWFNS